MQKPENFFVEIFDCIQDGISILDKQLHIVCVNRTMEKWYAHAMPLVGKLCYQAYHGRTEPCEVCPSRTVLERGEADYKRVPRRGPEKSLTGWLDLYSFPLRDANGVLVGVIEHVRDATEQQRAEEALVASEQKYRRIVELSNEGIVMTDSEFCIVFANERFSEMVGYSRDELVGMPLLSLVVEEEKGPHLERMAARRAGAAERFERLFLRKNGSKLAAIVSAVPLMEEGRFQGAFAMVADITELKRTRAELEASEARYRLLFSEMAEAFALHEVIWDGRGEPVDYRFLAVNPAFEKATGLRAAEVIGRTAKEVLPKLESRWLETYAQVVRTGDPVTFESYTETLDRHYRVHAYRTSPNEFACLFIDISDRVRAEEERRRVEAQLQYAQKLESLGILAGGVAHDFNNILMAILGNAELAREDLVAGSRAEGHVREIEKAAQRAADLCRQMLAYSGKTALSVTPININDVIVEMKGMLEVSVAKKAVLKYNLAESLPCVVADVSQIRQVIMNLVINGAEAVTAGVGLILVSTGVMECDAEYLTNMLTKDQIPPGRYVFLEVSDTGNGINPEILPRICDPFFTTKSAGRGLGLAAVLGIVRAHKGAIKVYSEQGKGTTFKVLFPAGQSNSSDQGLQVERAGWKPSMPGTVLVVDDEESVRDVVSRMMERLGFQVITAAGSREAVTIFATKARDITCVLLDLTMPDKDGVETFGELRRIRPEVPVILCSGYTEHDATQRFVGKGLAGFLQKPYTFAALADKLREVLERTPSK